MMNHKLFSAIFLFLIVMTACSTQKLVIRQMEPILLNTVDAFYEEQNLEIAQQALAANLKLAEGLLKSDPQNKNLLRILAQGYAGYALSFVEDTNTVQARQLYLRARDYALRFLKLQNPDIYKQLNSDLSSWQKALETADKEDVPALFWTGFAWSSYINLALEDPTAIMGLARVEPLMQRVMELDSTYFYGAVFLFFGSLYGQKPPMLGGNPQKAKSFFERNLKLTKGKFLLTYVYAARFYAAKVLDEQLFDAYLEKVLNSPDDILPQANLLNQVARQKARRLLARKSELF